MPQVHRIFTHVGCGPAAFFWDFMGLQPDIKIPDTHLYLCKFGTNPFSSGSFLGHFSARRKSHGYKQHMRIVIMNGFMDNWAGFHDENVSQADQQPAAFSSIPFVAFPSWSPNANTRPISLDELWQGQKFMANRGGYQFVMSNTEQSQS